MSVLVFVFVLVFCVCACFHILTYSPIHSHTIHIRTHTQIEIHQRQAPDCCILSRMIFSFLLHSLASVVGFTPKGPTIPEPISLVLHPLRDYQDVLHLQLVISSFLLERLDRLLHLPDGFGICKFTLVQRATLNFTLRYAGRARAVLSREESFPYDQGRTQILP